MVDGSSAHMAFSPAQSSWSETDETLKLVLNANVGAATAVTVVAPTGVGITLPLCIA